MCVKIVKRLLLHTVRVQKLKLVAEGTVVAALKFLHKIESLHLNESCLDVSADMVDIWLEHKRVEEAVCGSLEVSLIVVR